MGRSAHILADDAHKLNNGDICLIRFAKLQNLAGIFLTFVVSKFLYYVVFKHFFICFTGKIQVSNAFDCSLVLINPSIEEARALNRRYLNIILHNTYVFT